MNQEQKDQIAADKQEAASAKKGSGQKVYWDKVNSGETPHPGKCPTCGRDHTNTVAPEFDAKGNLVEGTGKNAPIGTELKGPVTKGE